jgi:hypothetical protein
MLNSELKSIEKTDQTCSYGPEFTSIRTFNAFIEYLFNSNYTAPTSNKKLEDVMWLHLEVYVFAERVCMPELKELAYKELGTVLSQ